MDLDVEFGAAFTPADIKPIERKLSPRSRQVLDKTTADQFRAYFETASLGLLLPQVNHDVLPILWALDKEGRVWCAMEEVVSEEDNSLLYPLPRRFDIPKGHIKLGHPSLLSDYQGRIGGEIRFDPEYGEKNWVISNKSGRYGFSATRERRHLENVAYKFEEVGIPMEVYYISTGRS